MKSLLTGAFDWWSDPLLVQLRRSSSLPSTESWPFTISRNLQQHFGWVSAGIFLVGYLLLRQTGDMGGEPQDLGRSIGAFMIVGGLCLTGRHLYWKFRTRRQRRRMRKLFGDAD